MPIIMPPGGSVFWPDDEGILGVVGVAPWATLEFCRCFYALVAAEKDWHYPRVLLDINTKLPSRGRHLQLGETDPSPFIAATIAELAKAGATVSVVACNTAHILFDRWAKNTPIPVINIVDSAIEQALLAGTQDATALTSSSLAANDLYGKTAERAGILFHRLPQKFQEIVTNLIEQIKIGGHLSQTGQQALSGLLTYLSEKNIGTVFLGCTELSILSPRIQAFGLKVIDSNDALARAAYSAIRK